MVTGESELAISAKFDFIRDFEYFKRPNIVGFYMRKDTVKTAKAPSNGMILKSDCQGDKFKDRLN